jgi:sugar-specific transcriptional regulator TrmB
MLDGLLERLGLPESERRILQLLVARGALPAGSLAKSLGMKRTTVYFTLEKLTEQGLVTKRVEPRAVRFQALPADQLCALLHDRIKRHYEETSHTIRLLLPALKSLGETSPQGRFGGYEIQAFESTEALFRAVEEGLQGAEYRSIWNPEIAGVGAGKEVMKRFLHRSNELQIPLKDIVVSSRTTDWYRSQIRNPHHEVKEVPKGTGINSDITITDGSIILAHYSRGEELAVRMRQRTFYETMRAVFDAWWAAIP